MEKITIGLVFGAVLALGGCATGQGDQPGAGQQQAAARHATEDEAPLTGSRLAKRKSTDRMVNSVGAQDARNAMESAPDPLKSGQ